MWTFTKYCSQFREIVSAMAAPLWKFEWSIKHTVWICVWSCIHGDSMHTATSWCLLLAVLCQYVKTKVMLLSIPFPPFSSILKILYWFTFKNDYAGRLYTTYDFYFKTEKCVIKRDLGLIGLKTPPRSRSTLYTIKRSYVFYSPWSIPFKLST